MIALKAFFIQINFLTFDYNLTWWNNLFNPILIMINFMLCYFSNACKCMNFRIIISLALFRRTNNSFVTEDVVIHHSMIFAFNDEWLTYRADDISDRFGTILSLRDWMEQIFFEEWTFLPQTIINFYDEIFPTKLMIFSPFSITWINQVSSTWFLICKLSDFPTGKG